jgi:F-type H+-transporting ATPase subunit b
MATNTSTGTQHPGGKPGFPPFQKETFPSQLFWLVIAFVLLYVLMAKVALPRVGAIIAARRARIDGDLADAHKLKADAETTMAAYEKALADARNRAQTIASETRNALNAEAEKRRKQLEHELNDKMAAAENQIAAAKVQAMTNVHGIAIEAASAIVTRLTGTTPADAVVSSAVEAALKR